MQTAIQHTHTVVVQEMRQKKTLLLSQHTVICGSRCNWRREGDLSVFGEGALLQRAHVSCCFVKTALAGSQCCEGIRGCARNTSTASLSRQRKRTSLGPRLCARWFTGASLIRLPLRARNVWVCGCSPFSLASSQFHRAERCMRRSAGFGKRCRRASRFRQSYGQRAASLSTKPIWTMLRSNVGLAELLSPLGRSFVCPPPLLTSLHVVHHSQFEDSRRR